MANRYHLNEITFRTVVENAPLVSIDLILEDALGRVLLGRRNNRPAKDFWFVPGGRIRKNESICDAFGRISEEELHCFIDIGQATFLGVYQHFYEDTVFGEGRAAGGTHYVALGYRVFNVPAPDVMAMPHEQHNRYQWWNAQEAVMDAAVHSYTKDYLKHLAEMKK